MTANNFSALLNTCMNAEAAGDIERIMQLPPDVLAQTGPQVSRRVFAMALNAILLRDLLERVPSAAAYVADRRQAGHRIMFDHGALRTISLPTHLSAGCGLPAGESVITRVLLPLGYVRREVYPLRKLRMTGRSYAHVDGLRDIPQFFVSELHVEQFPEEFQLAAQRVFGPSRDPLTEQGRTLLAAFEKNAAADMQLACAALPELVSCFDRQHDDCQLADYEALLQHSKEAAWMATEGNAFNHATDRVADVVEVAEDQRRLGRRVKDSIEVSASGRIRQTAFRADMVERRFQAPNGAEVRRVPGSFFEFISRAPLSSRSAEIDLAFDSSNAQGIFEMTRAAAS